MKFRTNDTPKKELFKIGQDVRLVDTGSKAMVLNHMTHKGVTRYLVRLESGQLRHPLVRNVVRWCKREND